MKLPKNYPDEGNGSRSFHLSDWEVRPDQNVDGTPNGFITELDHWDAWARPVLSRRTEERRVALGLTEQKDVKMNHADDITRAAIAFLRTRFGDPTGGVGRYLDQLASEGKGLRFAFTGDLYTGGGQSSSSAILTAVLHALNQLSGANLSVEQIINAGFAERIYTNVEAGTKDHSHINTRASFRGVVPARPMMADGQPLEFDIPPGVNLLQIDSMVDRDSAPIFSARMREFDQLDIKRWTGGGYALGLLWIRHLHPDWDDRLKVGRSGSPNGLLRELDSTSPNGLTVPEVYRLLKEIPAEGLTREQLYAQMPEFKAQLDNLFGVTDKNPTGHPEPSHPYPIRELVLFGFAEEARNWEMVRNFQALSRGDSSEQIFPHLVRVGEIAQNGDRVVQFEFQGALDNETLEVTQTPWDWQVSDEDLEAWAVAAENGQPEGELWSHPGWLPRSIEPLDYLADLVKFFDRQHGGGVAVAFISGAGLGGAMNSIFFVQPGLQEAFLEFLGQHYYRGYLLPLLKESNHPNAPAALAKLEQTLGERIPVQISKPGRPASIFTLPAKPGKAAAGLEATAPATFVGFQQSIQAFSAVRANALTVQPVFIVTPEPAAIAKLTAAVTLTVQSGMEEAQIEVLAQDAAHAARLQSGLAALGLRNFRVHDVAAVYGGNVGASVEAIQFEHWQAGRSTQLVTAATGLESVVRFLGAVLPEASAHAVQSLIDTYQRLFA